MAASTKKLGLAVLGLGRMGMIHSQNINQSGRALLKWFVRNDVAKAEAYAQRFMVPPRCVGPMDLDKVLDDPSVDGVVVCSSTSQHESQVKAALSAGKKVLCEKPITDRLDSTADCYTLAETVGQPLLCAFHRRFDDSLLEARRLITTSRLRMLRISSHDNNPPPLEYIKASGGILSDSTIHDLDLALWMTGSPVKVIYVHGQAFDKAIEAANDHDLVTVTLEHQNGVVTLIDNGRKCAYGYDQRLEAICEEGSYVVTNRPTNLLYQHTSQQSRMPAIDSSFDTRYPGAYSNVITHFLDVMEGAPLEVTKEDTLAVMQLVQAGYHSLRAGKPVDVANI